MSIDRPRRIFRSNKPAHRAGFSRAVLVTFLVAAGGSALVLMGLSGSLFGRGAPGPDMIAARAGDVAVIDGDTLRLASTVVRLTGLMVPARGQACAAGPDCGGQATAVLANLVRDRDMRCQVTGHDGQGRPTAWCNAGEQDLSAAMVSAGWAKASGGTLADAEREARARHRGQWRDN